MSSFTQSIGAMWDRLGVGARSLLVLGCALVIAGVATTGWWLLRSDYQVLFAAMDPKDSALMVAELEKMKIPYRLDDAGNGVLVPQDQVLKTRMKLMGKDLPLHGAVGFELFNNSDFGITEFAQKVNYQRALQGELTRTILALAEVQSARVHLVLPEQGLFRKTGTHAKASITLALRDGAILRPEQISGIQRLVSSAVPDIAMQDVTIVGQDGVALSRQEDAGGDSGTAASSRLDLKRLTEDYLSRKATLVLDQAFGAGQALVKVDVNLNLDQIRTTTEDVLPMRQERGAAGGVLLHERETRRSAQTSSTATKDAGSDTLSREADYQYGKRVEQVVSAPGAIRKLHVATVLRRPLDNAQSERLRELVGAAVGASRERGDVVVIYSVDQVRNGVATAAPVAQPGTAGDASTAQTPTALAVPVARKSSWAVSAEALSGWALFGLLALIALCLLAWRSARASRPSGPQELSDAQRSAVLADINRWLSAAGSSHEQRQAKA